MADRPWFRTRTSGLGWTPITWEGWVATVLSAAAFLAIDLAVVAHFAAAHR